MKVAFLTFEYPGVRPGGVGGYVFKTAGALAQAGHDVHIVTIAIPETASRPAGVKVHTVADLADRVEHGRLPGPLAAAVLNGGVAIYKLAVAWLLTEELRRVHAQTPIDIVEAAEYEALGLPLMLRPIPGVPVITQPHLSSAVNRRANDDAASTEDELVDALEAAAIVGADGVYAATRAVARETRHFIPTLPEIPIIPYCTPVSAQSYGVAPRKGHVLYVGRLQRRKGVEDIAIAAADFLAKYPNAEIHIAGEDVARADSYKSMQNFMKAQVPAALRDRMIFKGEISPAEVQAELAGCRFALAPSRVENFAGTVVDTLLAARALIYAGGTGTQEVAGDAGICVPPASPADLARAMHELWNDDETLDELAARGPARMRQMFSAANTIDARVAFYQSVIDKRRGKTVAQRFADLPAPYTGPIMQALGLLTGLCAGAHAALSASPGQTLIRIFEKIAAGSRDPQWLWLFGAGRFTQRLLGERYLWESRGYAIEGIIDDAPRFAGGKKLQGIPVMNRQEYMMRLAKGEISSRNLVLSTDTLETKFWQLTEDLRRNGVAVVRMSDFS